MKVKILQKHIRDGIPKDPCGCPIALAMSRKWPTVEVNETSVEYCGMQFELPAKAQTFIKRFDEGKYVKPFEFDLKTLVD